MYTQFSGQIPSFQLKNQILSPDSGSANAVSALINVKADCTHAEPVSTKNNAGERPKQTKKGNPKKRKKKGGYRSRKCLTKEQLVLFAETDKLAREAGCPLNTFVSFRTPANCSSGPECKRVLAKKVMHLIQAIKGRGKVRRQQFVPAVTVYEHPKDGTMDAHVLVYVEDQSRLESFGDGELVHVRKAVPTDRQYMTKERIPGSPEFKKIMADRYGPYRPAEKIKGVKISFNSDAKILLSEGERKWLETISQPTESVNPLKPSVQPIPVTTPILARLNPSPYVSAIILAGRTKQTPLLLGPVL